jgi:hypothetical protein
LNARTVPGLSCPSGRREITYWSKALPRFGLRCRDTGERSWVVLNRNNSRLRIGDAQVLTFSDAFKEARRWLAKIALGQDPRPARQRRDN